MLYFDFASTTPLRSEVLQRMTPFLDGIFANPDSTHAMGRRAAHAVMEARDEIAHLLGVSAGEVYFTSGGTEADNWAAKKLGRGRALVFAGEHAAVLTAAKSRAGGYSLIKSTPSGEANLGELEENFPSDAGLMCLMKVNNETGCIQPIERAAALCRAHGSLLFSDCVQAAPSCDLAEVLQYADAIAISAHKIGGPKGVGALIVKKHARLSPLITGGEQERGLRGGTTNVAGVVGLAAALDLAVKEREKFVAHTETIQSFFEQRLRSEFAGDITIDGEHRAPNISHVTFLKAGEEILHLLDLNGAAASGGAACSAHAALPSHVMMAMGKTKEEAKRGVRFSFGLETRKYDVFILLKILKRISLGEG